MKTVPGNQRNHDHKGHESADRRPMWRGEAARIQARDWRRPVEANCVTQVEDLEMECERWDGLS